MALSTSIKTSHDAAITLKDGTGTPVTLAVPVTIGDETISELMAASTVTSEYNETIAFEARGKLTGIRHGARIYPSGSFSVQFREFTNATAGAVLDFIRQTGGYSGNATSAPSAFGSDVYLIDLLITVEGTDRGDGADHTITMTDCRMVAEFATDVPDTLSIAWTCYGTITATGPV